jgi:DNA polymerase IV
VVEECLIAHLDMDAFYVGVELLRRPELRGRPVVVAGSGPRAVVTTASYEARRFGIFSATPAARARRLCPEAVFLVPDFEHYRACSREVMQTLRDHFDTVEVVGLDEAYVDLTGIERPRAAVVRAREDIRGRTGLGCSIGIGPSKLVAKMASDAEKPDGLVVLTHHEARRRFATAPPRSVPGIGPRTAERLSRLAIRTIADLADTPEARLADLFGARLGPHLRRLARFEDDRLLETVRLRKSESRETTFDSDIGSAEVLEAELRRLSGVLGGDLSRHGARGRTVGIKIRLDDFTTHTRARTLPSPTGDPEVIGGVALQLLRSFAAPRPVRLLGVRVAGLDEGRTAEPAPEGQLALGL